MSNKLPKASIHGAFTARNLIVALVVAAVVGTSVKFYMFITSNRAVNYGEATIRGASCEPVATCYASCTYQSDIAICTTREARYECTVGGEHAGCSRIAP